MTDQASVAIISTLLGGVIGVLGTIISGFFNLRTSKAQIEVANINAEKEIFLQQEKARNEVNQKIMLDTVEKLLEIHMTASKMAKEYSQTRSHIDWTDMIDRAAFRRKYRGDCNEVNKSIAVTDVYLAEHKECRLEIRDSLSVIYGNMNIFWGNQEELLRNDEVDAKYKEIHKGARITAIIDASNKILKYATNIQSKIVEVIALVKEDRDVQRR